MHKVENNERTLSMTEINRGASSIFRSMDENFRTIIVTRHNKPFAVLLPIQAYNSLVGKRASQVPASDPRRPMVPEQEWGSRPLEALVIALFGCEAGEGHEPPEGSSLSCPGAKGGCHESQSQNR